MRTLVLTKYHALSMWNWRAMYLGRLIEPIAYFAFLAPGVAGLSGGPLDEYMGFVLSGMACLLAFRAATNTLSDVANDRKWGVFAIHHMQGGGPVGYLVSIMAVSATLFTAQLSILLLLAVLIGGSGTLTVTTALWLLLGGGLVTAGWVGLGALVGARLNSYDQRDLLITVTTLPVVLSAPLFYPLESVPGYLRAVAAANPLTYQVAWLRLDGWGPWSALAACVVWALVCGAAAVASLHTAEKITREQ